MTIWEMVSNFAVGWLIADVLGLIVRGIFGT